MYVHKIENGVYYIHNVICYVLMKKIILTIAGILVVIAIAILLLVQSRPLEVVPGSDEANTEPNLENANIDIPEPIPVTVMTYRDPSGVFEIDHPDFYDVATTTLPAEFGILRPSVRIESPEIERVGTNLIQSATFVAVSEDLMDVARCLSPARGETKLGSITVGSDEFTIYTQDGVAAGNNYQTVKYRTVHDRKCVESVLLMHSGNIGNYPEETVKEFDRGITLERLKAIFYSLRLK